MTARTTILVLLTALAGLVSAACTSGTQGTQPQAPAQPTSTLSATAVQLPAALPNLKTLLQRGPASGSADAGSFYGRKGQVWIDFSCLGAGVATLTYQPVGSVEIPCGGAAVNATKNQINFPGDHRVDLKIDAPAGVRWAVLVQQ